MKRNIEPLQKVSLNLFLGDLDKLKEAYPRLGASWIVRKLVRDHLREIAVLPPHTIDDLTLEEERASE